MPSDPAAVRFTINGKPATAPCGASVAAALLANGVTAFRRSANGSPRGPLCGMGICFECRLTVNGQANIKSCMVGIEPGDAIVTDGAERVTDRPKAASDE